MNQSASLSDFGADVDILREHRGEFDATMAEQGGENSQLEQTLEELQQTREELLRTEKLASVGRLAAGVAHEINTPIQFIGDNLRACAGGFKDINGLIEAYRDLVTAVSTGSATPEHAARIQQLEKNADLDYLLSDLPSAFSQSLDGVERVRTIVQGLKDFSRVDATTEPTLFDLNAALTSTLTVARNEIKYAADVETDFDELPQIKGRPGELNQVFLNLLVNAADAIRDKSLEERGLITIRTHLEGEHVHVAITDTGCGIPDDVRRKMFDLFYTTKEIGRGTGQGLAISENIVRSRHGGQIEVETEVGRGTTFRVILPVDGNMDNSE